MNPTSAWQSRIMEHVTAGDTPPASGSPPGVATRVFVSGLYGASGLSTGAATFEPLAALPCHDHECSEAVTVLEGIGTVLVDGRMYELGVFDCIHVPAGVAHAVCNESPDTRLVMHWARRLSSASGTSSRL